MTGENRFSTDKADYILLPERTRGSYTYSDLLVSSEKVSYGALWKDTHLSLIQQGGFMLPIREFLDFKTLLSESANVYDGNGRRIDYGRTNSIRDEILTPRGPWRAEWLDAYFDRVDNDMHIFYSHRLINGELRPKRIEHLEDSLLVDGFIDLGECNKFGLPSKKVDEGTSYYSPMFKCVTWFSASPLGNGLCCSVEPRTFGEDVGAQNLGARIAFNRGALD